MKLSNTVTLSCPQKKAATCQVQSLKFEIASTIHHFSAEEWNTFIAPHQSFLSHAYLQGIEAHNSQNEYFYVLFSDDAKVVGCAAFQLVKIKNGMRVEPSSDFNGKLTNLAKNYFNSQTFRLLVCGNAMVTGDYGFHFDYNVDQKTQIASLTKAIDTIKEKTKLDMVILKDFQTADAPMECTDIFSAIGYNPLKAQPNMHLNLRSNWESFDDYLADMTSKARTRVKKNIKRGKSVFRKDLTLEEVQAENETIYKFYRTLADRVDFNLSTAGPDYFLRCKEAMGDQFKVLGYYLEDRMIGFITLALSESQVESHFIGFDESVNKPNALYPNILLDQIRFCIEETNATSISFGRTALEIKSSFGAEPQEYLSVGWAKNPIYHRYLPNLFNNIAESDSWVQRRPFKEK